MKYVQRERCLLDQLKKVKKGAILLLHVDHALFAIYFTCVLSKSGCILGRNEKGHLTFWDVNGLCGFTEIDDWPQISQTPRSFPKPEERCTEIESAHHELKQSRFYQGRRTQSNPVTTSKVRSSYKLKGGEGDGDLVSQSIDEGVLNRNSSSTPEQPLGIGEGEPFSESGLQETIPIRVEASNGQSIIMDSGNSCVKA